MIKILLPILLFSLNATAQVSGKIIDHETKEPLPYVNVWIKNTTLGATTNADGNFNMENAKPGDTLLISNLGFDELIWIAEEMNNIQLSPKEIALEEVVIAPIKQSQSTEITTYGGKGKIKNFYFNGHYALARFFEKPAVMPGLKYLKSISMVTLNALKSNAIFKVYLVKADENGYPSKVILSDNHIIEAEKGRNEITIDFIEEKIIFPQNGVFVVVERLNLDQNKYSNKIQNDILQPAIGMENISLKRTTWMTVAGVWYSPEELNKRGDYGNIAVNIQLTD